MIVKAFWVLISASVLLGCENKPSLGRESSAAAIQPLAAAEHIASVEEWVPTAIDAAPAGSAQAITLEAVQNAAKDAEEGQEHE